LVGKKRSWLGKANTLSWDNLHWPIVDRAVAATLNVRSSEKPYKHDSHLLAPYVSERLYKASAQAVSGTVIRNRRSALDFVDGMIRLDQLIAMLARILPNLSPIPFDVLPQAIHIPVIGIYVFGVKHLRCGYYALVRDLTLIETLKETLPNMLWKRPKRVPQEIPLFLLQKDKPQKTAEKEKETDTTKGKGKGSDAEKPQPGDAVREASQKAACFQAIAKTSAFTMAMFSPMTSIMQAQGVHHYRNIHWEAGLIGHVLYLEAEAQGLGATGMGCFLDDTAREDFGMENSAFHDFYHFTVGFKKEDTRFTHFNYEENMFECVEL